MNKRTIAEMALTLVTGASVGLVVKNAVKFTTPATLKSFDKVMVWIGSALVSDVIATEAAEYVTKKLSPVLDLLGPKAEEK